MQVNSISSLLQLQQLQALTGNDGALSTDNTTSSFASLLQGMLQNNQAAASQANPISSANSSVSGLDSLSLDPQKLAQMLQLQSMENMLTNAESADSDNSDEASDDSTSIMPNTANDMSQMYSYILEALNQNPNQAASTAAAFTDSSGLVSASTNTESSTSSQS